jgi:ATP-binding cassette, subfamily B, multidrug efflux pump
MNPIRTVLHFIKPYRKLAFLSLFLLAFRVLMDLTIPRLIERIIDQGIKQNNLNIVLQTSAWMISFSIVSTIAAVGNNIFSVRVGEGTARDIREAVFLKIQEFSYGNLDRFTTGKLMVRLTSDSSAVQRWVQVSLRIGTSAPLTMIGSLILMFNTNSQLALIMIPLIGVTSAVIVFFSLRMEPLFRTVQDRLDKLNNVLQENITGARLVKAFGRAHHEAGRFDSVNTDLTNQTVRVMQFMSTMSPALTIFANLGIVVVIWAGGLQAIHGTMTIGQLVAFTNYLMTTMNPLMMMNQLSNTWANGLASTRRINEVLEADLEVQEDPAAVALSTQMKPEIVFKDVSFHYNGSTLISILDGINLRAEPGKTIAILGATGSGKTSLVNLIPRFYDTSSGQVMIDGIDVRHLQGDSLLSNIGIVPQESILFSGTVRDNIRYGRSEATEEEVISAARAAQAHDFILGFQNGYDTHIEERGVNLSGGQKQRIAIARAILTQPRILILDDSTSAVDVETENRIQTALGEILKNSTRIIVAQRISTVLNADKIIVIDQGRLAAEGTHSELVQSSSIYREIYDSQLGDGFQKYSASNPVDRGSILQGGATHG